MLAGGNVRKYWKVREIQEQFLNFVEKKIMENNKEKKKPRKKIYGVIFILCCLSGGFLCGWIIGKIMDSKSEFTN